MAPAKKKHHTELGKSLQRRKKVDVYTSTRHTTDDQGSTVVSITDQTSIDEFLSTAEAAHRIFEAERGHAAIKDLGVVPEDQEIDPNYEEDEDDVNEDLFCSIPKKPIFTAEDTAETFQEKENESFLKWKRSLARLQAKNPKLPPFERNLEFWRQLWHIIEISDVVVQVVDARDPLFYQSSDLAQYIKEVDDNKESVLLLNKADLLSQEQRQLWSQYFQESDTKVLFFSATLEEYEESEDDQNIGFGCAQILNPRQVLEVMKNVMSKETVRVGFTGYPNVGKSSTINRFLTSKKLKVSATPGKTKTFQTHLVDGGSCEFIDGPGLVIPNLNMDRASMVLGGILPIDTLVEYMPPMDLLLKKIPLAHLLHTYGIAKSCVLTAKKSDRKLSPAMLFLTSFGLMRGFVKAGGQADQARAAKIVLKDFVEGHKVAFCAAPPNVDQNEFCQFVINCDEDIEAEADLALEESFPELRLATGVHMRGRRHVSINGGKVETIASSKKHGNKKKREKLRRLYNESPYM